MALISLINALTLTTVRCYKLGFRVYSSCQNEMIMTTPDLDFAAQEQKRSLNQSLTVIRQQSVLMRKYLDSNGKLMDALKHASTFLAELRTSILGPKQYYELYISIFDALNDLGDYLRENHSSHHLADLYELVQYAGE